VWFTDPSGKEGEEKNNPQFKNGSNFPLEKNYSPVSSTSEMTPDENFSFSYKWGGSVTKYHDDALDRDFSVLEQRKGTGEQSFFSWVNKETGKAEIFTGDNKNSKGEWSGRWVEFESAEKRNVRLANETADAITKGFIATGIGLLALPVAVQSGLVGALASEGQLFAHGTKWAVNKYGKDFAINLGKQLAVNDGDISKVDWFDVTLSTANPFGRFGFAGRAMTEAFNSAVDIKGMTLSTIFPETSLWKQKSTSEVVVDFVSGYAKAGAKGTFSTLGGNNPVRDLFIDYISGKHKQAIKSALHEK